MTLDDWDSDGINPVIDMTEPPGEDRRAAMLARRAELAAANPEIRFAYELAPLMGDLEGEYWAWQLDNYLAAELGESNG